jgi:hypothetical protein
VDLRAPAPLRKCQSSDRWPHGNTHQLALMGLAGSHPEMNRISPAAPVRSLAPCNLVPRPSEAALSKHNCWVAPTGFEPALPP